MISSSTTNITVDTWRIIPSSNVIAKGTNSNYNPSQLKLQILHNTQTTIEILKTFGDLTRGNVQLFIKIGEELTQITG